ncbi:MAG: hypothetical protein WC760_09620 [Bacteroidia bacterium]|jgi:hypothetical protein
MKRLCFYVVIFICTATSFAQRGNIEDLFLKRGIVSLEGGASFPVMDYAVTDFTPSSGYANVGFQGRLSMSYEYTRYFGIKLMYLYNQNPFNDEAFKHDFEPIHPYVFPGSTYQNIQTKPYVLSGLMLGVVMPLRMAHATYSFKVMGGVLGSVLPQQDFSVLVQPNNTPLVLRVEETEANDLAYIAGVDIRHRLHKDWLFTAYLDFLYTEQTYTNIRITNTSSGMSFPWSSEYTQYYHIVGVGIGLAYQFE